MAVGDGADQRWHSLAEVSQALAEATQDLQAVLDLVARRAVELIGDGCAVLLASEDEAWLMPAAVHHCDPEAIPFIRGLFASSPVRVSDDDLFSQVFRSGKPVLMPEITTEEARQLVDPEFWVYFERFPVHTALAVPLRARGRTIGTLVLGRHTPGGVYTLEDQEFLQDLADRAALGIANARLFAEAERQVRRLGALRAIDMVITSSLDLGVTLDVILDRITAELGVDAATFLLLNPYTRLLEVAQGRGFLGRGPDKRLPVGEGFPRRAALERRTVSVPDLSVSPDFLAARHLDGEGFASYFCAPLVAKGLVKGVLEVFNRSHIDPDADWIEFFEILAGQSAIAIDSAEMFEALNRANAELLAAYDQTLEGWVRALDLRDKETEGHTARVTEMSVVLAQSLGTTGEELVHLQRGARLHDIGKMAVPDDILLKPGQLTPEEREVIARHPVYAREMLSGIPFLRPALDIPYCHHEHWDGSGYPRHLKGEDIPPAARVFTIVDVWDALSFDRPYRKAWPRHQVIDYIRDQSGALFDPKMVEAFLDIAPYRMVAGG
jgi:response regulator RpfG family c-di-GMP phosphodiesterase